MPEPCRIAPATEEDIRWAADLGARVYGGQDVIDTATMLAWYRANPHGFSIFWAGGRRVGNFDLLPLRPATMQRFVAGQLLEREIGAEDLFAPAESAGMQDLHWESIVIDPEFMEARSRLLKLFVASYPDLLARVCPPERLRHVYAIAASSQGEGVLRRLGLAQHAPAEERRDGHPLFRGDLPAYAEATRRHFPRLR